MKKEKKTFRNSFFFLIGVIIYSLLFWLTGKNYTHVFGSILIAVICYLIYMFSTYPHLKESKYIKPWDVIYFCIGVIFDSFSGGFPFNILPPF